MLYKTSPEFIYDWKFVPFDHHPQPPAAANLFPRSNCSIHRVETFLEGVSSHVENKMTRDKHLGESSHVEEEH